MANIYNITAELEDIFLELEENGGELTPELEERLAITQDNLKSKLDGYRKAYTVLNLEAESCKKEEYEDFKNEDALTILLDVIDSCRRNV